MACVLVLSSSDGFPLSLSTEWYLVLIDQVFLAIYIVELSLKLYVWRLKFFKQFWNNFGTVY